MVLSKDQVAVIKNDFTEKSWNASKIWRSHPSFNCSRQAVYKLVKKLKETGSGDRRKGSGRPVKALTDDNLDDIEELMQSQESQPGTHSSLREVAADLGISKSSVHRGKNVRGLHKFQRESTPQMSASSKGRRIERCAALAERIIPKHIPLLAFQDESMFTLQIRSNKHNNVVYGKKQKA